MESKEFDALQFIESWRQYSTTSSLNGLYIVGGLTKISKLNRIVCLFFFLVVCGYCIFLWNEAVAEYQSFPLKTSITYNYRKEIQFPAITITSPNQVRVDTLDDISYVGEAQALHYSEKLEDAKENMKKMKDYCTTEDMKSFIKNKESKQKSKAESAPLLLQSKMNATTRISSTLASTSTTEPETYEDMLLRAMKTRKPPKITEKIQSLHTFDSNEFFKLFGFDSSSVLQCKWDSKDVNCSDVLYNHIDDILVINDFNLHFSFNLHPSAFLTTDGSILKSATLGYGMNHKDFNLKMVKSAGKQFGLRLAMYVDHENYCGIKGNIYNGAGYQVSIHDPKSLPNVDARDSLFLSPGYEYDIEIRPETFDLRTEFLGRCTTQSSDIMKSLNITHYTQQKCTYLCVAVSILKTCKCRLGIDDEYIAEKLFGLPHLPKCIDLMYLNNSAFACLKEIQQSVGSNFLSNCPECKRPCLEKKYSYSLKKMRLTSDYWNWRARERLHDSKVRKKVVDITRNNTLLTNFYFPEMIEIEVIENLKTDELDLFLNLAGTIGLLLGASVMTIYEVLHQVIFSIFDSFTKQIKKERKRPQTIHVAA